MPVSATATEQVFDGNGSTTTAYPLTIPRDRDEDIKLQIGGVVSTDFTISTDGIRTGTAVQPGTSVVVYRETPLTQSQPFPSNTTPAAEDTRAGLDKLTLIAQELNNANEKTIQAAPGSSPPGGNLNQKANTTIGQDASGNIISRTAQEEIDHLGIQDEIDAAAASATASAASATASAASAADAENTRQATDTIASNVPGVAFRFSASEGGFRFAI